MMVSVIKLSDLYKDETNELGMFVELPKKSEIRHLQNQTPKNIVK